MKISKNDFLNVLVSTISNLLLETPLILEIRPNFLPEILTLIKKKTLVIEKSIVKPQKNIFFVVV